jgi:hypothetical protein
MGKSKVRVHRLTLPPSPLAEKLDTSQQEDEGTEDHFVLEKEQFSRITEISLMAGEGRTPRPHVHGVEPSWRSKFWANEDDDASSVSSTDEEFTCPKLVNEALEARFSMDQIHQAKEELSTPPHGSSMVC